MQAASINDISLEEQKALSNRYGAHVDMGAST